MRRRSPGWKQATWWSGPDLAQLGHAACACISSARGQRSANAQPAGSSRSDGTRPGISRSRLAARSSPGAGSRRAARSCTGAAGARRARRPPPPPPCGPAYITSTRSAMSATTPRLCVIEHDRRAEPLADVAHQVEDPCLDRHVERRRRLVGDRAPSGRTRAPSRSSRAGASRRRAGADTRRRRRSGAGMRTSSQQLDRARARGAARQPEVPRAAPRRSGRPTVKTGLSERHRLLEDERDLAAAHLPQPPRRAARAGRGRRRARGRSIVAVSGSSRTSDMQRDALAAPRLADDAENLARARARTTSDRPRAQARRRCRTEPRGPSTSQQRLRASARRLAGRRCRAARRRGR